MVAYPFVLAGFQTPAVMAYPYALALFQNSVVLDMEPDHWILVFHLMIHV